jgi:hypothetical protein
MVHVPMEVDMVRKVAKNGAVYHEPPYTWQEEMEFYRRVGGATSLTILHGTPPAAVEPAPAAAAPAQTSRTQRRKREEGGRP